MVEKVRAGSIQRSWRPCTFLEPALIVEVLEEIASHLDHTPRFLF